MGHSRARPHDRVDRTDRRLASSVGLVIGSGAHTREPRGRARCRGPRRIDGQPEVRQDLLDHRTVRDRRQQAQPPAAVGARQHVKREHAAEQVSPGEIARLCRVSGGRRTLGNCLTVRRTALLGVRVCDATGRHAPCGDDRAQHHALSTGALLARTHARTHALAARLSVPGAAPPRGRGRVPTGSRRMWGSSPLASTAPAGDCRSRGRAGRAALDPLPIRATRPAHNERGIP